MQIAARANHSPKTIVGAAIVALVLLCPAAADATRHSAPASPSTWSSVIVQKRSSQSHAAEALVRRLGGTVTRRLPIVRGFAARLPSRALARLAQSPAIGWVSPDSRLQMRGISVAPCPGCPDGGGGGSIPLHEYDALDPNRVWWKAIGVTRAWAKYKGAGVGVALLDTGVTPTADLQAAVALRLDFTPAADGIDRFGHGTHMAGIIVGNGSSSRGLWAGIAPAASLISIKIAGPDGATDASIVLAALQWIVSHKDQYRIRVVNMSFGTDSKQSYLVDPLDYAVERVWKSGIAVVAAAGNIGPSGATISKPGDDPFVITVGADDVYNTVGVGNDAVTEFSSRGPTQDGIAKPDLIAPGVSIVSVLAPGSTADRLRTGARLSQYYMKGTGTSQATAIVTGVAALMLSANPALTPDQLKAALLASTNGRLRGSPGAGAGLVAADRAVKTATNAHFLQGVKRQPYTPSTGNGSINASRGTQIPYTDLNGDNQPDAVEGEIDALGAPWDAANWPNADWSPATWLQSPWADLIGIGSAWDAMPPPARTWPGLVWAPEAWSSKSWSDSGWVSKAWSSKAWSTWN